MVNMTLIPPDELLQFTAAILRAAEVPGEEADCVAESLVEANLRGHDSHGVVRVPDYLRQLQRGHLQAGVALRLLSETPAALQADAGLGFGFVQMRRVLARLIPKVREMGVASAAVMNCGHVGRLGEWAERAADEGCAAFLTVNDNGVLQCVAPPGGRAPRISTNPLAIGVPLGEETEPLVLDISTSAVANGKIKVAHVAGQACPPGWLQDHQGNPTTDPKVRFEDPRGTILPMGGAEGYKGFGLGLLLDVLVGGLAGGFCPPAPPGAPGTNNVLLVVWDPERFAGGEHFRAEAKKLIAYVRQCPRKEGVDNIRLPGDRSRAVKAERLAEGVPLDEGTWQQLCRCAEERGVRRPAVG